MTKIYCKYTFIQDHIVKDLDKISKSLKTADNISNKISIPSDFAYYNSLKKKFNEVENIINSFSKDSSHLNLASKISRKTINEFDNMISEVMYDSFDLEVRQNIIF